MRKAFEKLKRETPRESTIWCPCSKCGNTRRHIKRDMLEHLAKYGFMKDYTNWTYHVETGRMRDEVVRRRIEELDGDAGLVDMIDDFHEVHFQGEPAEEEPEPSAKAVVWTSLGPLPRWVPGPTTRWAPGTTRLALHGT
jgi:hypothetical protein